MLGIKKFFYYLLGLALLGSGILAIVFLFQKATDAAGGAGILCLVLLAIMLYVRHTTKCPHCKKVWVGKKIGDEDLGVSSNAYTKKVGDSYRTYEKHKHLLSYKCTSCGNEWQKTVEKTREL